MRMILLAACAVAALTVQAADEPKTKRVWNFQANPPAYGYEKWTDLATVGKLSPEGWMLTAPAAGGFGLYFNDLLNVEDSTRIRFRVVPQTGHTESELLVKLHAADGRQASWKLPVGGLEAGKPAVLTLDLSAPQSQPAEGPIDLGIIRQIQVQGSFHPEKQVQLLWVALEAELRPLTAP